MFQTYHVNTVLNFPCQHYVFNIVIMSMYVLNVCFKLMSNVLNLACQETQCFMRASLIMLIHGFIWTYHVKTVF